MMDSFFVACQLPLTMLVDGLKELESCAFEFGGKLLVGEEAIEECECAR